MPKDWKGWPNGKKFALVLTHDVESPKGVRQVKPLIELEKQLGFRSSLNFVGRDYHVPEDLLETLRREGFEVGVHGLHHDGMMFATKASFRKHAKGINIFLKQWDAVGFRSPSMHQKLEWIHELDIRYDSSTFDTDPFEPQPEGVRAIFPFWVVNEEKTHAFVELPYTLAQDFTLFILLRFMDIDIWKRKLDWIAENGGMALLNTHPDYMCWDGAKPSGEEYPVQHYRDLLEYIRNNYQGYYHHALPHEIASHFSSTTPSELSSARLLPQI